MRICFGAFYWSLLLAVVVDLALVVIHCNAQEQQVEIGPDGTTIMSSTTTTKSETETTTITTASTENEVPEWKYKNERTPDEMCTNHIDVCNTITRSELYTRRTGSAMMYKPNQPQKRVLYKENHQLDQYDTSVVYWELDWNDLTPYENKNYTQREWNVAYNTIARESYIRADVQPPTLILFFYLWNCSNSTIKSITIPTPTPTSTTNENNNNDNNNNNDKQCCCKQFTKNDGGRIDIWHSYPNGTYPSLRRGVDDGVCRGYYPLDGLSNNEYRFYTMPPGSTGLFNGLYTNTGFDVPPYSPPVIHTLIQTSDMSIDDLLIDIPIVFENINTSYVAKDFEGPDLKGMLYGSYALKEYQNMKRILLKYILIYFYNH
jgi:hypothetical protein